MVLGTGAIAGAVATNPAMVTLLGTSGASTAGAVFVPTLRLPKASPVLEQLLWLWVKAPWSH